MVLRVALQSQVYQDNLNNLLFGSSDTVLGVYKGIPSGKFTNIDGNVTQYSTAETSFSIYTDTPGVIHTIRATLISNESQSNVLRARNRVVEKQFTPANTESTISIALLKGENQIDVFTSNESTFTTVIASHTGTFVTTYARELFVGTQNPLNEQTQALFSDFSSRMTEILIPFQDLYADPKSLRALISRFIARSYMTKSGSTPGVRDFTAALLGTTPVFAPTQTDQTVFEPDVVPIFRSQLEFGGYEAHTWIPNYEIAHWLCFVRLINNARHFYTIQEIGEHEILVLANGFPERHLFNFDDPSATAYSEFNFTDFRIVVTILDKLGIEFCAAAYPFDLFVTADNPLGQKRIAFDSTIDLDSGELLDAPALDPGDDGWVGLTLSGRFESLANNAVPVNFALDSLFITPSPGSSLPTCVYDGFFTQQVSVFSGELDIDEAPSVTLSTPVEASSLVENDVETTLLDFSTVGDFTISGYKKGSLSSSSAIALSGTASVKHTMPFTGAALPIIEWTGSALDMSDAGGQTVYFTVFVGEEAIGTDEQVENIPSYPGNLDQLGVLFHDSSNRTKSWIWWKEDLSPGTNVLPLFLDFPDGGHDDEAWDASDIVKIQIVPYPTTTSTGWTDLYFGRLHKLDALAAYRPARAKIELEDIEGVFPESLWGSELIFTDRFGTQEVFTGDPTYNDFSEGVYYPRRYKIQRTAGTGTEGFARNDTALNLQRELGRQLSGTVKSARVTGPGPEKYVNVFTSQFSPTGDRKILSISNPNPEPDLIDITSFAGGTVGYSEPLLGVLGSALAQQFQLSGASTAQFLELHLHRVGDPVGGIAASIHADNSGRPGDLIERAEGLLARDVPSGAPEYTVFRLFTATALLAATPYWIVVSGNPIYVNGIGALSGADAENHIVWSKEVGGYSYPRAETTTGLVFQAPTGFWTVSATEHHYFKITGS
jgi:hypothetical protein